MERLLDSLLLADHGLPVVTGDIVELDSIPVHVVEDGQAALSPVRLGPGPPGEGPGVLASGHGLCLPVLPSEAPGVPGDAASGPEVGRPVCGHQPQEVLGLLLGVEADQLHALAPAVGHAPVPVKVVPPVSPGQKEVLALVLIIAFGSGRRLKSLGRSHWGHGRRHGGGGG